MSRQDSTSPADAISKTTGLRIETMRQNSDDSTYISEKVYDVPLPGGETITLLWCGNVFAGFKCCVNFCSFSAFFRVTYFNLFQLIYTVFSWFCYTIVREITQQACKLDQFTLDIEFLLISELFRALHFQFGDKFHWANFTTQSCCHPTLFLPFYCFIYWSLSDNSCHIFYWLCLIFLIILYFLASF